MSDSSLFDSVPLPPRLYNRHHGDAPEDAVYIGRGTPWGNPFIIGEDGDRGEVIAQYDDYVSVQPHLVARIRSELRGRDLVCSCVPKACHGTILIRIANS